MTTSSPSFINVVPGAFNLRELGGTRVAGGVIRPGSLYRSDLLNRLDAAAAQRWLDRSAVRVLVDLRTDAERDNDGYVQSADTLSARHHSLLDEVWSWRDERESGSDNFLRDRTIEMYERHPGRIVEVLETLVSTDGAALFHCTAGKDRTGVVASALLGVLGADDETIIADYARSTDAMPGIVGWYRDLAIAQAQESGEPLPAFSAEVEREIIERAAAPETMRGVLDAIAEAHGSIAGWAKNAGVDDALVRALRQRFVLDA